MLSRLFALLLILLLLPIYLLVSIIIFFDDGFPIIIKQKRTGINNIIFDFYKFRTMRIGTPDIASKLLEKPDSHLLRTGKLLRKLSLDEFPQFFNVLKGDMAFVGPRPLLANEEEIIELRSKKNIHKIMPGITGWAQINGRDSITNDEKVKYDGYYLKNKSLFLDTYILFITIKKTVLFKDISH